MLKNWWRALAPRPRTARKSAPRRLTKSRPALEALEDRFAPAIITVTSLADNLEADGFVTLREALQAANDNVSVDGSEQGDGADIIQFDATLFPTPQAIDLVLGALELSSDVTISGPGVSLLTVQNGAGRVFSITSGAAALSGLTISGVAGAGGGIDFNSPDSLDINGSVLEGNSAADGGALSVAGGGMVTIQNSLIAGNHATGNGGGIHVADGTVTLTNVTLSGNSADGSGGAIAVADAGTLNLVNSTLAFNQANADGDATGDGGGLFVGNTGTVNVVNTIIAGNVDNPDQGGPSDIHHDVSGTVGSLGTNLIGDSAGSTGFGATDILDKNALLAPLDFYDGATRTHALLPGSPGIDAGQTGIVGGLAIPTEDQRGFARTSADIGAFESRGFTITIQSGNGQRTLIETPFDDALVVLVASAFAEPVEGGRVTFTASAAANGASAILEPTEPVTIGADGLAQVTATANNVGSEANTPYDVEAAAAGADTVTFSLTNQIVAALAFEDQPTDTKSGTVINPVGGVTVRLLDQDGEFVPKATHAVVADVGAVPLFGTTTRNALGGVATFDDLVINKADNDYQLTASLDSDATVFVLSALFDITASALRFLPLQDFVKSDEAFDVQVEAIDADGERALNFTGDITIAIATNHAGNPHPIPGQITAGDTTVIDVQQGLATFSGLKLDRWGDYTFAASDSGTLFDLQDDESEIITVTANALRFLPLQDFVRSDDPFTVQLEAIDITDDRAQNFASEVTIAIATNHAGNLHATPGILTGDTTVNAVLGLATFSDMRLDRWGDYTFSATDDGDPTDLTDALSETITVTARELRFLPIQDFVKSDEAFNVQVEAVDVTLDRALNFESDVTIAIATNHAGNAHPTPGQITAGDTTETAVDGLAQFTGLKLDRWGNYTFSAADSGTPTDLDDAISEIITVTANALRFLSLQDFVRSDDPFTVHVEAIDITEDRALNFSSEVTIAIVTNHAGNPHVEPGVLTGDAAVDAVLGLATFSGMRLDRWGDYTFSAVDDADPTDLTDAISEVITVTARELRFLAIQDFVKSDEAFEVEVEAIDVTEDRALNFESDVTIAIATNHAGNPHPTPGEITAGDTTETAVDGLVQFTGLKLDRWGDYTFSASDSGTPTDLDDAISEVITVTANALRFVPFSPSERFVRSDDPFTVRVEAIDVTDDRAQNFTSEVTIAIETNHAGNPHPTAGVLTGDPAVNAVLGLATFSGLKLDRWGDYTFSADDSGTPTDLTEASSGTLTITARELRFVDVTPFVRSGNQELPDDDPSRFTIQVEGIDVTGDRALNFTSVVTIVINDNHLDNPHQTPGVLGGDKTKPAVLGLATFTGLTLDRWGNYTLSAVDSGVPTNLDDAESSTITVTAYRLVVQLPKEDPKAVKKGRKPTKTEVTRLGIGKRIGKPAPIIRKREVREFAFFVTTIARDITGDRAFNFSQDVFMTLKGGKLKGLPVIGARAQLVSEEPGLTLEEDSLSETINRVVHKTAVNGVVKMRVRVTGVGGFVLEVTSPNAFPPEPPEKDDTGLLRRNSTGRRRP